MRDPALDGAGLPAAWEALLLKRVCTVLDCKHVTAAFVDDGFPVVSIREVQARYVDLSTAKQTTVEYYAELIDGGRRPQYGDLLFSRNATVGEVAQVASENPLFAMGQDVCLLRPLPHRLDSGFAWYMLRSSLLQAQLNLSMIGSTFKRVNVEQIRNLAIPLPPLLQQVQIVEFLDAETANIDALIAKQEQLIATLREDRTATITHAITQGIDPAVELVQPNDEELPACPRHWTRQISLKRVASIQTGLTLGKTVDLEDAVTVPYLRVANVQTSGIDLAEVKTVEVLRADVRKYLLRTGDVLMTEGGDIDKLGRGCVWGGEISPCVHQNHVFAVRCTDALASGFLVYLLDTSIARNYFFMTAKKTTNLASTNSTTLGAFTFSLPPRPEQNEIVKFLDHRCAQLDALTAKAREVIVVLREYRAGLIADAVTGKIDARAAA